MTNAEEVETKTYENVIIRKAENGFMLIVTLKQTIPEMPEGVDFTSDEMGRWHMEQDIKMHNNQPKTYVFESFKSLCQFVEIQTGWS